MDEAARAFTDADAALRNGDPVEYLRKLQEGRRLFDQARQAETSPDTTTTTTSTPGAAGSGS